MSTSAKTFIPTTGNAFSKKAWGWTTFEFARNPYYMIIVMYIFAPYAALYIGDSVLSMQDRVGMSPDQVADAIGQKGQSAIAKLTTISGLFTALTVPFFGAALDFGGRRKPLMAFFLLGLMVCAGLLWWVKLDGSGWSVTATMTILAIGYSFYTYTEVIHNSQLSLSAAKESVPFVSGIGLALGNLAVIVIFLFMTICFLAPAVVGAPFAQPLFGIDATTSEEVRIAGPIVVLWMLVFIPFYFLWTEDGGTKGARWIPAIKKGTGNLIQTFKNASEHKEALKFLFARMLYADGMSAALALGAVFIGTFLQWNPVERVIYALIMSVFCVVGGLVAGFMDRFFGPRNALIIAITTLLAVFLFQLSITRDSLFFGYVENYEVWNGPIFSTLSDWVYLSSACLLAICGVSMISSSRSMMVYIAPKDKIGEFFGLFSIVGTITAWVGPLLIAVFTDVFKDQRIGMGSLTILFLGGLIMLFFVKVPKETQNV